MTEKVITQKDFMMQFNFKEGKSREVGIEREGIITDLEGNIIPIAPKVIEALPEGGKFGYELSACQIEDRIGPVKINNLKSAIDDNEKTLKKVEKKLGFKRWYTEVAPKDMPLDIYPDPTGRYQQITKDMPREILLAACRVAAIHIHIGMPDHDTALAVYNKVTKFNDQLCQMGDRSNGERLSIYKIMAPDFHPPYYHSWKDYYKEAVEKDFISDPRKCWHIIRIAVHGTIEFRMFGSTADIDEIVMWAEKCYQICSEAMAEIKQQKVAY